MVDLKERYLVLLKHVLTDYLRVDNPHANATPIRHVRPGKPILRMRNKVIAALLHPFKLAAVKPSAASVQQRRYNRQNGVDWPPLAETMIGLKRLDHLQSVIETILHEDIPGDLLEAGVWRGGATIFMQAVLTIKGAR